MKNLIRIWNVRNVLRSFRKIIHFKVTQSKENGIIHVAHLYYERCNGLSAVTVITQFACFLVTSYAVQHRSGEKHSMDGLSYQSRNG